MATLTDDFYPWQKKCVELLINQGPRNVLCVHEEEGGVGKTVLSNYLRGERDAVYVKASGSVAGIMHQLCIEFEENEDALAEPIIVIDVPRSSNLQPYIYEAIEEIKSGILVSHKYNGRCLDFGRAIPKVLILANTPPSVDKLTPDRWEVYTITFELELIKDSVFDESASEFAETLRLRKRRRLDEIARIGANGPIKSDLDIFSSCFKVSGENNIQSVVMYNRIVRRGFKGTQKHMNTLIRENFGGRVREIRPQGKLTWKGFVLA